MAKLLEGRPIAEKIKEQLKEEIENLFDNAKWDLLKMEEITFIEPPHPGSRPFEHEHSSYLVLVRKK